MRTKNIISLLLCICITLSLLVFTSCQKEQETETPITALCFTTDIEEGERILGKYLKEVTGLPSEFPEGVITLGIDEIKSMTYYTTAKATVGDFLVQSRVSDTRPTDETDVTKWITKQDNSTDHIIVKAKTGDRYEELQRLIDENPNRTIYFSDGVYDISRPLVISMKPEKRVSLRLSQYAVLAVQKSSVGKWSNGDPVLHFGKGETADADGIGGVGARIYLSGGTIDGKEVADGIKVEGSGNLFISHIAIKNFVDGVDILTDNVDIYNITGVGNGTTKSTYINVHGRNNTISNLRMCNSYYGIILTEGGNTMRNLHPLITSHSTSLGTVGFDDSSEGNFYDYCYADQHATAFKLGDGNTSVLNGCYAYWWSAGNGRHWGIHANGIFNSVIYGTDIRIYGGESNKKVDKAYIIADEDGGAGKIIFANVYNTEDDHKAEYSKYAVSIYK